MSSEYYIATVSNCDIFVNCVLFRTSKYIDLNYGYVLRHCLGTFYSFKIYNEKFKVIFLYRI